MNEQTRKLISERMGELKVSQVELAKRLSMTSSHVSRILSGERGTTLENLLAFADVLRIDRTYILQVASGHKIDPDSDPWVETQSHKLNLIPPNMRTVASRFIESMIEGEQNDQAAGAKRRTKTR